MSSTDDTPAHTGTTRSDGTSSDGNSKPVLDAMVPAGMRCGDAVAWQESTGVAAAWTTETAFDPFQQLTEAASRTSRIALGTAVAVAFARNPMSMAVSAHHLHIASGGRLLLGLGTQVKAHIERRYSMPWSRPAARMREYVQALRAIWAAWNERTPLSFSGEFYSHTLMAPLFDPGPSPYGPPPVYVAGVNLRMAGVAGEVGDGYLAPPLASPAYLAERLRPAVREGRDRAEERGDRIEICAMPFVATGRDQREWDAAIQATRTRIAFYASTPAYAPIFDLHGWTAQRERLTELSRSQEWEAMAAVIDDTILETFAVVAPPHEVAAAIRRRYAGLADRTIVYSVLDLPEDVGREVFATGRPVSSG